MFQAQASETFENELNLDKYIDLLLKNKKLFITAAIGTFLLIPAFFQIQAPTYVTQCDIVVEKFTNSPLLQMGQRTVDLPTRLLYLKSERLLSAVSSELSLKERLKVSSNAEVVSILQKWVNPIESVRGSNVINIQVAGPNPKLIAEIANTVADAYIQQDLDDNLYISRKVVEKYIGEKKGTDNSNNPLGGDIYSLPFIVNDAVLKDLRTRQGAVANQINDLSQLYKDGYPPLALLLRESKEIEKQKEERVRAVLQGIKIGSDKELAPRAIRIINYASVPRRPSYGKRIKITILAILLSQIGLFSSLILKDLTNKTIRTEKDLKHTLFLGSIPRNKSDLNIADLSEEFKGALSLIRTAVLFCMPKGHEKCILVTSPLPLEGKTTVATGLAVAMADANMKTILIGADMRRPGVSKLFNEQTDFNGLSDYLEGVKEGKDIITNTFLPNLDLIIGGAPTTAPSSLLTRERFPKLLEDLKMSYDKIIIDSPPLLMGVSDTLLLSRFVDSLILVIRSGKTEIKALEKAEKQLKDFGVNITGVILNFTDPSQIKY